MDFSFLIVSCRVHKNNEIAEKLNSLPGIKKATPILGAYDCIAKTEKMNSENVHSLVLNNIQPLDDVVQVLTLNPEYFWSKNLESQ